MRNLTEKEIYEIVGGTHQFIEKPPINEIYPNVTANCTVHPSPNYVWIPQCY
ncbi:hypothetical protein [Streptobacillus moniliformis]|uniref:hypothetical protein n=1 Tax=Streptobacillus moniliformis TaxID=34105 RepID=UPI000B28942E|nr:hypothetical protein [Streptobacillus moniliformis]